METEVTIKIGELAARTGVSVRSLRYYEEQGLLASSRTPSGQRRYTEDQAERVGYIQRMYRAGLSSKTVRELMPCLDAPSADTADTALVRMIEERERLDTNIAELTRTRDSLDVLIANNQRFRAGVAS